MAFFAENALFQEIGVASGAQHFGVMVAFQNQTIGFAHGIFNGTGDGAKIGGQHEGFSFSVENVANRVSGVVGEREGFDA